ncbi:MAG: ABC transporter ATP-binding protein [Methylobacteriaceae bacterium]|nr:ABC transporter ATP-binding protein [Methylobacteriaceae bacterium]
MSLELKGIRKAFRTNVAVDDVSLDVADGEIVVVFGPSGTGKTVLLRIAAGIHDVDAGQVLIDGRDVTTESPDARGLGMAFQNFALFPHMTAFDNVASALRARKATRTEIAEKVEAVGRLLKIDHVLSHYPRELSNGQKQRTALARALVAEPKVLLLDDPLRNVDAKLRYEMRLELPNILKRFGSAVLYVTQDYKEAMALGDRIALLLHGRIAQVAAPAQIYELPASVEVARLFGDPTINLVAVDPVADREEVAISIANTRLNLGKGLRHAVGLSCTLGVRPEAINLHAGPQPNSLPVEIIAETPLNEKTVVLTKAADGQELLASRPSGSSVRLANGRAYAAFDPAAALIFERDSGRRIERRAA